MHSVFEMDQAEPIVTLHNKIILWQLQKQSEYQWEASSWLAEGHVVTVMPHLEEELLLIDQEAAKCQVQVVNCEYDSETNALVRVEARVATSGAWNRDALDFLHVDLDIKNKKILCPCQIAE